MKLGTSLLAVALGAALARPLAADASTVPISSPKAQVTAPGSVDDGLSRLVPVTPADDCTIIGPVSHAPYTTPDGSQWDAWTYANGTVGLVKPGSPAPDPVCISTTIPPHGGAQIVR